MKETISLLIVVVGGVVLLAAILVLPTWALWNWVAVDVLGLKHITLLQSLGIGLLSGCLFRGFHHKSKP